MEALTPRGRPNASPDARRACRGAEWSDAEYIKRSLEQPAAFEPIFDRHFDRVRRYARRRLGPGPDEEIAAQVFLTAFERRASYDPSFESALPWLLGIATNTLRRYLRRAQTSRTALQRLAAPPGVVEVMDVEATEALLAAPRIHACLRQLPEKDREAFLLVALGGFTYEEVAHAIDIPVGTVRSKLHRVRRNLRERLSDELARTPRDER